MLMTSDYVLRQNQVQTILRMNIHILWYYPLQSMRNSATSVKKQKPTANLSVSWSSQCMCSIGEAVRGRHRILITPSSILIVDKQFYSQTQNLEVFFFL
jgi:hypothetical protein